MSKFKKVIYITLGGALGGMISVYSEIPYSFFVKNVYIPWRTLFGAFIYIGTFGASAGLGISLGDILTPGKNSLIKISVQTIMIVFISCFIFRSIFTFPILLPIFRGNCAPYIFMSFFSLTLMPGIMALGISIGKEATKKINLFWVRIASGTIVSALIVALFCCFFTMELLKTYAPMAGCTGFGIIFVSSLFDKKINKK
ncbi:MAG: hypothetical protein CO162_04805 [bacterium (Candidatus Ratteibacteria) CG_4_9_14_3_um_filter_41_21]|uniref:Uncharacterized protein n=2 Tax=Candidatus Ratteibacteria TaxID=2979319 RepID=A0A2M7YFG8_9BACT|nr:MAG: hypothetical protein COW28_06145 [bacterium (Candidatus Ratteibacteria) CG15_BIG_FIL_POST_REV_8_21_14_020_41_12]PJA61721.1 MAG: hypothetical protein CO162_04805 [bacterium (Candidatus Ratteibacteria) CG_4_9_14_3_um_filter_41_21]